MSVQNITWVVITSIYPPSIRLSEYLSLGWRVVVVSDKKTDERKFLENLVAGVEFLSVSEQISLYPELSTEIGFNTYARKNLGYLFAIERGATRIWDTDDDTFLRVISKDLIAESYIRSILEVSGGKYFNPYLKFAPDSELWPRGYPLKRIAKDKISTPAEQFFSPKDFIELDIVQTLVNLEPDLDSIYRLTVSDEIQNFPISDELIELKKGTWAPGNTQSTMWQNRDKFAFLYLPSTVSFRFCDILKMYVAQKECSFGYMGFISEQIRNPHNYLDDFRSEIDCFLNTDSLIEILENSSAKKISEIYRQIAQAGICTSKEVDIAEIFEESLTGILNKNA